MARTFTERKKILTPKVLFAGFVLLQLWWVWHGRLFYTHIIGILLVLFLPITLLYGIIRVWKKGGHAFKPFLVTFLLAYATISLPQTIAHVKFWLYYDDYVDIAALIQSGKWPYDICIVDVYMLPPKYHHLVAPSWFGDEKRHLVTQPSYDDNAIEFPISSGFPLMYEWWFSPYGCIDSTIVSCRKNWQLMEGDHHGVFRPL